MSYLALENRDGREKLTAPERRRECQELFASMEDNRREWDQHWQDVADYLAPYRYFTGKDEKADSGKKRMNKIFEARPMKYNENLASMMQSGLTSPARPWLRLGLPDPDLSEWGPARAWLDVTERIFYQTMSRSNFYPAVHSVYKDLTTFGTACLSIEETMERDSVHFQPLTLGTFWVAMSAEGKPDTVYRLRHMMAKQMLELFGPENLSRVVKEDLNGKRPYNYHKVMQVVRPRDKYDPSKKDNTNMSFESLWYEKDSGDDDVGFLRESGYRTFPAVVPRWDLLLPTDTYGISPAMEALPDIKTLNEISKAFIKAAHMEVEPPVQVDPNYKDIISLLPGGMTGAPMANNQRIVQRMIEANPSLNYAQNYYQDKLGAVKELFYNDLFLFLLRGANEKTAREIDERSQEKLLLLGPVVERMSSEFLDPTVDRLFDILYHAGRIPPPPPEIQGMPIKVDYISLLAQSQKLVGTQALGNLAQFAGTLAQFGFQDALLKIDAANMVDAYADAVGAPVRVVLGDEQFNALKEQLAQAQAQAQAQATQSADIQDAKALSETETGPDSNALTSLMQMMGGA